MLSTLNTGGVQSETDCTPVPIKHASTPISALNPAVSKPGTALPPVAAEPSQKAKPSCNLKDALGSAAVGQRIQVYWDGEKEW